ncbi:MAG: HD domain-containing protein [Deltaproteobacteria bacterium]|jgi:HD-GYP domain-containing protein (c-di-GMP phosphodiesterase class II)|nr:HD domain-containing protein [Deltaproteobacteria bacterium]
MAEKKLSGIQEDYYQIGEAVLFSFPKYRMPLDLFLLDEKVVQLLPFYKKDTRLSNEQIEALHTHCDNGLIFVSRADHPIYSQHIIKQLDLVLVDQNLKQAEVADIFVRALNARLNDFFEQPVKPVFEVLYKDVMVFTEYLWTDKYNIKAFMARLHKEEYSVVAHTINTLIVGLWLFLNSKEGGELSRKELDNATLAFLLHDIGMSKVPAFILKKTSTLNAEEKDKIRAHVLIGAQTIQKLDLVVEDIKAAALEHHERLDGSGYPQKLNASKIRRMGAICAVADSFSAMLQKRSYAPAKDALVAARELAEDSRYDKQFSAALNTALATNAFGKDR